MPNSQTLPKGNSPTSKLLRLADEWLDERRTIGRGISTQTEAAYRRDGHR